MSILVNSYFAGAGLMELGLQRAGLEMQQSFEIDPVCVATHRLNFDHEIELGARSERRSFEAG